MIWHFYILLQIQFEHITFVFHMLTASKHNKSPTSLVTDGDIIYIKDVVHANEPGSYIVHPPTIASKKTIQFKVALKSFSNGYNCTLLP